MGTECTFLLYKKFFFVTYCMVYLPAGQNLISNQTYFPEKFKDILFRTFVSLLTFYEIWKSRKRKKER